MQARLKSQAPLALAYCAIYFAWLICYQESELVHWLTLVSLPLLLAFFFPRLQRGWRMLLESFGLVAARLRSGYLPALLLGLGFCLVQFFVSNQAAELRRLFTSTDGWLLLVPALALMLATAGFTEEFFFRGFLQTRLSAVLQRPWLAICIASVLFALYHVPYAYLKPSWPSHGDLGAALALSFGQSIPTGLLLGWVYQRRGNLLSAALLHALIDTVPAVLWLHTHIG